MTGIQSSFFDIQQQEDITFLCMLPSRLTEEENLEQLDRDLSMLTGSYRVRNLVLDLTSVQYMSSAAIGKLISLHRRLGREDGQLVLCNLQQEVSETLETSNLLTYFKVAPTAVDALSFFR